MRGSSHTAALVTLYRAIESSRPPAMRLFDDPFAPLFLGWRFRTALRLSRLPVIGAAMPWSLVDGHWSGPRGTVAVRTRYIDDCLGEALHHGVKQVVILGAGFDCRAYRIREIAQSRVFEADHPATQATKKEIVSRRLRTLPSHVTYVPIDFTAGSLDAVMQASGYRPDVRTFFVCEGVTHYLPADTIDTVFRYVSRSAPGSQLVFTYIHRGMLDGSAQFTGADNTLAAVRRAGEPYRFGFEPGELSQYLAARNLALVEDVGADAYRARYLAPRGRGGEPLSEYQRAALANVVARA
jgi:methyltransferase (TIGR00027 family)